MKKQDPGIILITSGFVFAIIIAMGLVWFKDYEFLDTYTVYSYTQSEQEYKVTAYCSCQICCGKFADRITASGYRLQKGNKLCAANFDFCTVLNIPGYGIAPVLDRGGAIKEGCIDVYFNSHKEALEWGVQYLRVKVLK